MLGGFRLEEMYRAYAGYIQTGVPLVSVQDGRLGPAGFTDDVGIYYLVPLLAASLGISIDEAITLFFEGGVYAALAVGVAGSFVMCSTWFTRTVSVVLFIALAGTALGVGETYIAYFFVPATIMPLWIWLVNSRRPRFFLGFLALAGAAVGVADAIRAHSGTAVALFILITIVGSPYYRRTTKIWGGFLLVIFISLPILFFGQLVAERDAYLSEQVADYEAVGDRHPFWHSIYIGFGYLPNDFGIVYLDEVASDRVADIDPSAEYMSTEYEAILRSEVASLVRQHPAFVFRTLFAKSRTIGWTFLKWGGIGLMAALLFPKRRWVEIAFACTLLFSALPGLLVMPDGRYLMGFVTISAIYTLVSIEGAAQQLRHSWAWEELKHIRRNVATL